MPSILGRDWAAWAARRFGGRLRTVTISRVIASGPNPSDPAGPPLSTTATYTGDGVAFGYDARDVDGEQVILGDYQVLVLLGTLAAVADDAVEALLDLGAFTPHVDTILRARVAGAAGDAITVELVGDAVAAAGTLVEVGTNVRVGFLPGATTVAQFEALFATSALARVGTAGTPGHVLDASDELAATALDGGADATTAVGEFVPRANDLITCPPPGQIASKTGRVVAVTPITHAAATCHVVGQVA